MYNIFWDFDGTLGYRDGYWSDTLYSVLLKNNILNISPEKISPYLSSSSGMKLFYTWHIHEKSHKELFNGKTWYEYYENGFYEVFNKLGLDKDISRILSQKVIPEYIDYTKWFKYNDVIEILEEINNKGYKNYILSNHIPELDKIVENIGLKNHFHKIYTSGNIGYEKPNIKIYEYVLNDLNINKNNCIIIGDSYKADIKGGESMGIKSILVRAENKFNYKWYCNDLKNIMGVIEKIIL